MNTRIETIGDATLYLGDCMDILHTLSKVDAVITDPPYGINENSKKVESRQRKNGNSKGLADQRDYGDFDWDKAPPSNELIDLIRTKGQHQVFFGGNYFTLPPTSCWLVWDKLNGDNDFADCELAWTNWDKAVRRLQWRWHGMIRQGNEERYHPTQKPLEVMKWVITLCPKSETILDPFMGSGTTGVAAIQMGRKFIGIEREPKYFDIACKRIEQAVAQPRLFEDVKPKQEQASLI
jgi:site-specific DNA-methyltransferase (adenine-specific)/modification methylase